jgi:hypothetical protein
MSGAFGIAISDQTTHLSRYFIRITRVERDTHASPRNRKK